MDDLESLPIAERVYHVRKHIWKLASLVEDDLVWACSSERTLNNQTGAWLSKNLYEELMKLRKVLPKDSPHVKVVCDMCGLVSIYNCLSFLQLHFYYEAEQWSRAICITEDISFEFVSIAIKWLNFLGTLYCFVKVPDAKQYLELAMKIYEKNKDRPKPPMSIESLHERYRKETEETAWERFKRLHTITAHLISLINGDVKDPLRTAYLWHVKLRSQLATEETEASQWAKDAADLAIDFAKFNGFQQSRYYLAAASSVIDEARQQLNNVPMYERSKEFDWQLKEVDIAYGDIGKRWLSYCSLLLTKSIEILEGPNSSDYVSTCLACMPLENTMITNQDFGRMHLDLKLEEYEDLVPCTIIRELEDAKAVVNFAETALKMFEEHYSLDRWTTDCIEERLRFCELYKKIIYFEDDKAAVTRYHQRRIELLESIIPEINIKFYTEKCKIIWLELGIAYNEIVNIEFDLKKNSNERLEPSWIAKNKERIFKGAKYLHSLDNIWKVKLEKYDVLPWARMAYHLGDLRSKMKDLYGHETYEEKLLILGLFCDLEKHCRENPDIVECLKVELAVAAEKIEVLVKEILAIEKERGIVRVRSRSTQ